MLLHAQSLSHVRLFATPGTVARQAPLSMGISRQEYWGGLPCPPPGDLPDPGIKLTSPKSPVLADMFFTTSTTWVIYKMTTLVHWQDFRILGEPLLPPPPPWSPRSGCLQSRKVRFGQDNSMGMCVWRDGLSRASYV